MIELESDSLWSKCGFVDGDILDDVLWDNGYGDYESPDDWNLCIEHETLARLVEKHLLPLLPEGIEIDKFPTCHNPIRVKDGTPRIASISVMVSDDEVLLVAAQVKADIEQP